MTSSPGTWTRWPRSAAVSDPALDDVEKRAEQDYSSYSLEEILQGVAAELPGLENELPTGIDKVAALRFGTDEALPTVTTKNIWRHPNAHPLTLLLLLVDRYGIDCMEWEPEALRLTLRKHETLLSESTWTKVLAVRTVLESPTPWRQWDQFNWVSYGLAGRAPSFVYLDRPEIGFLMSAVDTMSMIDKKRPFAEDLDKFVAAVFREAGITYAPPPLQFAQEELDDHRIKCRHCGTLEKDDHDIKCVACGSKDLQRLPAMFESTREQTKSLFGARKRMPLEQAVAGLNDTAADVAAYKLLVHNEYRNQIRAQLLGQLKMLKGT